MAIRLQEMHPSLVHFPIALLPVAIGTDLVGRASNDEWMLEAGRRAIGVAAVGAVVSALSGLVAQEEVNVEGETMDMLITHRNLNVGATIMVGLMAAWRARRRRPTLGYLGLGLAGIGVLGYSAYLGGTLAYRHGVGVVPAGGQYRENPPELGVSGETGPFLSDVATDLVHGASHFAQETAQGKLAPSLGVGPTAPRPAHAGASAST